MSAAFRAAWPDYPLPEELNNAAMLYAINEMYLREARALGMAEGDTVIDRRLKQKMDYMLEDLAASKQASEQEIEAFKNQKRNFVFPDNKNIDPNDPASFGFIEIGTVVGPHGVHGEVKVKSSSGFPKR